ncbi:MAG TPA: hypothetical protein VME46_02700 [Acidimicrobiales bacterium]|nr:hypothetical protein [Acidimicrobiales bacterium]
MGAQSLEVASTSHCKRLWRSLSKSHFDQSVRAGVAAACVVLVLATVSAVPVGRAPTFAGYTTSAQGPVRTSAVQARIPVGLQEAIHAALGLGPAGLGTARALSGKYAKGNVPVRLRDAGAMWSSSSAPAASLTNAAAKPGDLFGLSVAISADGTTALVGADDGFANGAGAAYIFRAANGGPWTSSSAPSAMLTSTGGGAGDHFGYPVALSADGTTALVGASGVGSLTGAAYVFHVPSEGSWASTSSPTATLTNSAGTAGDLFGLSVAISANGTTALVGAPGGASSEAAYVFQVPSEGSWASTSSPTATLANSAGAPAGSFGGAVALSQDGTTALVGAPGVVGSAYVFHVPSDGSWASTSSPTATLTNSAGAPAGSFGGAVALSQDGTTALVGAPGVGTKGAAYLFHVSSARSWAGSRSPTAVLTSSGAAADNDFGYSVAISADGATALIGDAEDSGSSRGAAYVFAVPNEASWASSTSPTATLTNASGDAGHHFGISGTLSADGAIALVGTVGGRLGMGAASVFDARSSGPGSFAGSYSFSYKFYRHGRLVDKGTKTIGFGTDGRWTMSVCSETGAYAYDPSTATVTFTDEDDPGHGDPMYTWVGLPSAGFSGLMEPTAGGSYSTETGTSIATPTAPGSCSSGLAGRARPVVRITSSEVGVNTGAAFDSSGDLWVACQGCGSFSEFSQPQLVSSGPKVPMVTIGGIASPNGIAIDRNGDIWVSSYSAGTLSEYTPAELTSSGSPSPAVVVSANSGSLSGPARLVFDGSGDLWAANNVGGSVVEYTPAQLGSSGAPAPAVVLSSNSLHAPNGLGFDAAGDLWVANEDSGSVVEFSAQQLVKSGAPAPVDIIQGASTGIDNPWVLAVDPSSEMVYVGNAGDTVTSYPVTASGDHAPYRRFAEPGDVGSLAFSARGGLWVGSGPGAASTSGVLSAYPLAGLAAPRR